MQLGCLDKMNNQPCDTDCAFSDNSKPDDVIMKEFDAKTWTCHSLVGTQKINTILSYFNIVSEKKSCRKLLKFTHNPAVIVDQVWQLIEVRQWKSICNSQPCLSNLEIGRLNKQITDCASLKHFGRNYRYRFSLCQVKFCYHSRFGSL